MPMPRPQPSPRGAPLAPFAAATEDRIQFWDADETSSVKSSAFPTTPPADRDLRSYRLLRQIFPVLRNSRSKCRAVFRTEPDRRRSSPETIRARDVAGV